MHVSWSHWLPFSYTSMTIAYYAASWMQYSIILMSVNKCKLISFGAETSGQLSKETPGNGLHHWRDAARPGIGVESVESVGQHFEQDLFDHLKHANPSFSEHANTMQNWHCTYQLDVHGCSKEAVWNVMDVITVTERDVSANTNQT